MACLLLFPSPIGFRIGQFSRSLRGFDIGGRIAVRGWWGTEGRGLLELATLIAEFLLQGIVLLLEGGILFLEPVVPQVLCTQLHIQIEYQGIERPLPILAGRCSVELWWQGI